MAAATASALTAAACGRSATSASYPPNLPNLSLAWVGPTGGPVLGFDFQGRDVLSRLPAGAQSSMLGPLAVVLGSMTAGILLAVTASWRRARRTRSSPPGWTSCSRSRASCSRCSRPTSPGRPASTSA